MSRPAIKWGQASRYFNRNGFQISHDGGDTIIAKDGQSLRIGHKYSTSYKSELSPYHLTAIKRLWGVTREDILNK